MAANMCYCYSCFDDLLFIRLGASQYYYKLREEYGDRLPDKPFKCKCCGCKVDPTERQGAEINYDRAKT